MKTRVSVLLSFVLSVGIISANVKVKIGDYLFYDLDPNLTASVIKVQGGTRNYSYYYPDLTSVNIPSSVEYEGKTYIVTSIGSDAFSNCSSFTSVTIPNSVTIIGSGAFTGCSSLTSVTIPNSVTIIGQSAFYGCSSLTSVTIPNSVTSIVDGAFYGCSSLTSVTIPNSVTSIGGSIFEKCSSLTSVTIPNSVVTSIGNNAFEGCSSLTSVNIGNNVTGIETQAFHGCSSLTFVNIPNSVTSIGYAAFKDCIGLTSVIIGNSVTNIGDYAFSGCSSLTSVNIPSTVIYIGYRAFAGCGFASIKIPNGVKTIRAHAFDGCSNLEEITIPHSVQHIGEGDYNYYHQEQNSGNIFVGCNKLEKIVWLARNCRSSGSIQSFWGVKTQIKTFVIGDSVDVIMRGLCYGMSNLDTLAIHCELNADSIGASAFSGCKTSYLGLVMSDSTPNIKSLFADTWNTVKEIELFPGSTSCGTLVGGTNHLPFMGNPSVEKITIPANIAVIPDSTFMNCTKLKEVTLGLTEDAGGASTPRRISNAYKDGGNIDGESWDLIQETDVKDEVFKGCSSLSSIYFGRGVKSIGASACENCTTLTRIHLSESLREIHMNAFKNCPLTSLKLPNSINRINQGAFEGCALTEIEIPASMDNAYGLDGRVFANNADLEKVVINCYADQCRTNSNNRRDQFEGCENIKSITLKTKHDSPALNELFSPTVINNLEELIYLPNTTEIPMMFNSSNCKFSKLKKLVLPEGLQKIGSGNFNGCHLTTLTLPSTLKEIGSCSFQDCRFSSIISKAQDAPKLYYEENKPDLEVFLNVSRSTPVGVPDKSKYMNRNIWKEFQDAIYAKNDHQPTTLATNEVNVTTTNNSATVSYPVAAGGSSASITLASQGTGEEYIYYNTDIPVDEANMPRRVVHLTTPENDMDSFAGYSFTIQSLEANTTYDYTVTIYNSTEEVLAEYTGSFTTLEDEATAIDQISNDPTQLPNKLLRNGQILILRGDHTYTVTGQELR